MNVSASKQVSGCLEYEKRALFNWKEMKIKHNTRDI